MDRKQAAKAMGCRGDIPFMPARSAGRRSVMGLRFFPLAIVIVTVTIVMGEAQIMGQGPETGGPAILTGTIANRKVAESSGLVASRVNPGVLWIINDSGNEPLLFALGPKGENLGSVWIVGANNRDWEDLAAFAMDGQAYLLIADVGDNNARRTEVTLYVVAEPKMEGPRLPNSVSVAWQLRLRYPDGPQDCESVAVDSSRQKVYLISKRTKPPLLFSTMLQPTTGQKWVTVRKEAELVNLEKAHEGFSPSGPVNALFGSQPTAMDISVDSRKALILTYQGLWLFEHRPAETWTEALQARPLLFPLPPLKQAEGACFDIGGQAAFVTSEGRSAPLYRFDLSKTP
jgi:hypothetical protein